MNRERSRAYAAVLALLTLALGLGITTAAPAQAATRTIVITDGAVPAVTTAVAGDRVRFLNQSTTRSVEFQVNGGFTTGPIKPGAFSATSAALAKGDYTYTVSTLGGLLVSGGGKVSVSAAVVTTPPPTTTKAPAAPTTSAPPAGPAAPGTTAPAPGTSVPAVQPPGALPPAGPVGPVAPAPVNTGGSGVALQPRLDTGSLLLPAPGTTPGGPAPQLAPEAPQSGFPTGDPGASLGGTGAGTTTGGTQISEQASSITDRLNDPSELRQYGLPAVIGLVLLAGAFSLVLRVLFATTSLRAWLRGEVALHRTA